VSTTVLIRSGLEEKLSVYSVLRGQNELGFVQPFFWRKLVKMIDVLGTFWCWSTIVYDSSKLESIGRLGSRCRPNGEQLRLSHPSRDNPRAL